MGSVNSIGGLYQENTLIPFMCWIVDAVSDL